MALELENRNFTAWLQEQVNRITGQSNHTNVKILMHNLTNLILENQYNNETNIDWGHVVENRRVSYIAYCVLITLYSILITAGALGNSLVIWAVIRRPTMRTLRNTFIINLAVSDLLLCLVTMPLTLVEIITKYWPLGNIKMSLFLNNEAQCMDLSLFTSNTLRRFNFQL